jgi:uncharacterized protein (TIGR01777 family)
MILVLKLLLVQTLLGAFDTLWHHELREHLPAKRAAATEVGLHALREFLYGCTFLAMAWAEWHGLWAVLLGGLVLLEIVVTIADFIVEDRTRRLPAGERALHTVLAINIGIVMTVLAPVLWQWWNLPTAVRGSTSYGVLSTVFTLLAVAVFIWSARNTMALLRHRRPPQWVREPLIAARCVNPRTILVSGATGFIGGHVVRRLVARGDEVIVLARDADRAVSRFGPHVRVVTRLQELGAQARVDAIINLAGAPIFAPWSEARRRQIVASRIDTTRELVQFAAGLPRAPRALVSASAVGYYGVRDAAPLDESAASQEIFQSQLCQQWEQAAQAAEAAGTRVVCLRIGVVLGRDGGALPQLARPARWALAAVLGSGRQWTSWIHIDDLVRLIEFALDKPVLRGALNAVAPGAVTQRQFQRELSQVLRRPLWLRVPAFVLRALLGEMAQLLVDGQRVVPARALTHGFVFRYPQLERALSELLAPSELRVVAAQPADFYFNGACPVCKFEMSRYQQHCLATGTQMRFIDATRQSQALSDCGLRSEHLERRVYLRDPDGSIVSGLPALIELWSRMPGFGWLAKLFSVPVLHPIACGLYDHVVAPSLAWWARARQQWAPPRDSGEQIS